MNLVEGDHKKPEFLKMNPWGRIPVLELDDGRILHESLAIIEYFEDLHPAPSMWGEDAYARAYARQVERIADLSGLIPIARDVHASNSPLGLPPNPLISEYHAELWARGLDFLETLLGDGRPYLAGDRVTVADCTLQGGLQFARFRELAVLEGRPLLDAWCKRFRERPTAEGTVFF